MKKFLVIFLIIVIVLGALGAGAYFLFLNKATVTFESNGGSAVESVKVNKGSIIEEPTAPTKTGFTFVGWYKEQGLQNSWNFASDKVEENTTLYAKWKVADSTSGGDITDPTSTYTVTFDSDGGSEVESKIVNSGELVQEPDEPIKEGFIFRYWYVLGEEHQWDFETDIVTSDITLVAKWIEENAVTYTVTYKNYNGITIFTDIVAEGDKTIAPKNPTKPSSNTSNFTFYKWLNEDGTAFDFNTPINDDITLTASYTESERLYTVRFNSNGGSAISSITDIKYDSLILAPTAPIYEGKVFEGWYTDNITFNNKWDFNTSKVKDNITLYAKYQGDVDYYIVTFDANGGTFASGNGTTEKHVRKLSLWPTVAVPENPTFGDNSFEGWYWDKEYKEPYNFAHWVGSNITLYAKWTLKSDLFTFTEIKSGNEVTGYKIKKNSSATSFPENLVIPSTFNGLPVVEIEQRGFQDIPNIKSVVIENGITKLNSYMFLNCMNLESVYIPESVPTTYYECSYFNSSTGNSVTRYFAGSEYTSYISNDERRFYNVSSPNEYITIDNVQYLIRDDYAIVSGRSSDAKGQDISIKETVRINDKDYTVKEIGVNSLYGFSYGFIDIPKSITKISKFAFGLDVRDNNPSVSIRGLYIPSTVETIEVMIYYSENAKVAIYTDSTAPKESWEGFSVDGYKQYTNNEKALPVYYGVTRNDIVTVNDVDYVKQTDASGDYAVLTYADKISSEDIISSSVKIGNSTYTVKQIGMSSFRNAVIENVTNIIIPKGVEEIKEAAFFMAKVQTIEFEENSKLENIEQYAFSYSDLKEFNIPSSVATMQEKAFRYSNKLAKVTYTSNSKLTKLSDYLFDGCTVLKQFSLVGSNEAKIIIPSNIESLGIHVFGDCKAIVEVVLPDNITELPSGFLYQATAFKTIDLKNVTSIGSWAFAYTSVTEIVLPEALTIINDGVFSSCSKLTSIVIPNSVTSIGIYSFNSCSALSSVTLPTSLEILKDDAFNSCTSLTNIDLPIGLQSIGLSTFGNSGLESIILPEGLTTIGDSAFYQCKNLVSVEMPDTITSVKSNVFYNCTKLENVKLSNNASISQYMFYNCTSLKIIEIPVGVKAISGYAFYYCKNLTDIYIPHTVNSINAYAFSGCINGTAKTKVTAHFVVNTLPSYASNWDYIDGKEVVGISTIFKGNTTMTSLTIPFVGTEKNIAQDAYMNVNTIFGGSLPQSLKTIKVTGGTMLPNGAFSNAQYLERIELPSTLEVIGYDSSVFSYITAEIVFAPNSALTKINKRAFSYYKGTKVVLPNGITTMGENVFDYCENLVEVVLPNSVTEIAYSAFNYCKKLEKVTMPSGLVSIGSYAFSHCEALKDIVIPKSVTNIAGWAFSYCYALESVTFESGTKLDRFNEYIFYSCKAMTSFEIPASVTSIGGYFAYGTGIPYMYIPKTVLNMDYGAMSTQIVCYAENTEVPATYLGFNKDNGIVAYLGIVKDSSTDNLYIDNNGFHYILNADKTAILAKYEGSKTQITIPNSVVYNGTTYNVTEVGGNAFSYSKAEKIIINDNIKTINNRAFNDYYENAPKQVFFDIAKDDERVKDKFMYYTCYYKGEWQMVGNVPTPLA